MESRAAYPGRPPGRCCRVCESGCKRPRRPNLPGRAIGCLGKCCSVIYRFGSPALLEGEKRRHLLVAAKGIRQPHLLGALALRLEELWRTDGWAFLPTLAMPIPAPQWRV